MDKLERLTERLKLVNQEMSLLRAQIEVTDVFERQLEEIRRKIKELEQDDD